MKPSLLTSSNSGCHAVDGSASPPAYGWVAVDAAGERDVAVRGLRRTGEQRLELVVALAREVDLRQPVARQVLARDPHAPDLHARPAVGGRVLRAAPRRARRATAAPRPRR